MVPETASDLLTVGLEDFEVLHDGSSVLAPHLTAEEALAEETKATGELVSHDRVGLHNLVLGHLSQQLGDCSFNIIGKKKIHTRHCTN